MCRVLGVSRSGYYAWRKRPPSRRDRENGQLVAAIGLVHEQSHKTYGSPRVYHALKRQGFHCGQNRVARLMRREGIRGLVVRRKHQSTEPAKGRVIAPDHIQRDFSAMRPNHKWVADITQLSTRQGWLYLAIVLDLYSRAVAGWAMRADKSSILVCDALKMAVQRRHPCEELFHHSDHGGQYTSDEFQALLKKHHIAPSMGRTGDCYDNAAMESFFASLKREAVQGCTYANRAEGRTDIFRYIEGFYNRQRLHSSIGYMAPLEYEQLTIP